MYTPTCIYNISSKWISEFIELFHPYTLRLTSKRWRKLNAVYTVCLKLKLPRLSQVSWLFGFCLRGRDTHAENFNRRLASLTPWLAQLKRARVYVYVFSRLFKLFTFRWILIKASLRNNRILKKFVTFLLFYFLSQIDFLKNALVIPFFSLRAFEINILNTSSHSSISKIPNFMV